MPDVLHHHNPQVFAPLVDMLSKPLFRHPGMLQCLDALYVISRCPCSGCHSAVQHVRELTRETIRVRGIDPALRHRLTAEIGLPAYETLFAPPQS